MRRFLGEEYVLLLLSFVIAITSWYYVKSTRNPQPPRATVKTVAVIPTIVGEPAYGYSVLGIRVNPPTVTIAGAPAELEAVYTVTSEPVVVTGATRDVTKDVGVVGPHPARPGRVQVSVQVAPAVVINIVRGVRVQVENAPKGLVTEVQPATVEVRVQGLFPVVNQLRAEDLSARVNGANLSVGRRRVVVEVQVPPRVEVVSVQPSSVTVIVRKGG